MNLLAQDINIAPSGGFKGFGPLGNVSGEGAGISTFTGFVSSAIGLMTIIAFVWFVFVFITGAIGIMTAGSDKQALENARKKIINGIVGVVVVIAAVSVISLIGNIFNIPFLNLPSLFNQIVGSGATVPTSMGGSSAHGIK
jgi:uncharacterized membrane protein